MPPGPQAAAYRAIGPQRLLRRSGSKINPEDQARRLGLEDQACRSRWPIASRDPAAHTAPAHALRDAPSHPQGAPAAADAPADPAIATRIPLHSGSTQGCMNPP